MLLKTPQHETLPAVQPCPQTLSHLLNPATDHDTTPHQSVDSLDPMAVDSFVDVIEYTTLHKSVEDIDVKATSAEIDGSQPQTSSEDKLTDTMSVELEAKQGGDNGQKKKRSVTDSDTLPRKMARSDRDTYKDLYEARSFRRRGLPITKSTLWSRIQNRRFFAGNFLQSAERDKKFRDKILKLDSNAIIIDPKTVRHFKCAKELKMKEPYNTGNFRKHIEKCQGTPKSYKLPAGNMKTIDTFFAKASSPTTALTASASAVSPSLKSPCPGLREASYPEIEAYLERTGALGGGGPSVSSLAAELFGKKYRNLSDSRKRQVKTAQRHEWLWHNDNVNGAVYSTKCTKQARHDPSSLTAKVTLAEPLDLKQPELKLLPCTSCEGLFTLKLFKSVLRKPQPADENYKYINIEYRNDRLASLFGRSKGLREIIEVSVTILRLLLRVMDRKQVLTWLNRINQILH